MAATITPGYAFGTTEQVTAAKLASLGSGTISGIVNAEIDASAAIVDTKLAQITTASKVHGSSFTGLASIPAGAGVIPAANVPSAGVASDGTVNPTNLLSNGNFESWSAGTSTTPDGWTESHTGTFAIARESSTIKMGTYSVKLSLTAGGSVGTLGQTFHAAKGIAYWKGRTVTLGCWVYSSVASFARVGVGDNVSVAHSDYHTGDSTWQWLTATRTLDASATNTTVNLSLPNDTTGSAYFDGAICVEGASAFAFAPKPLDASAQIVAETDETKFSHKLPVVINGTTYYIMMTAT